MSGEQEIAIEIVALYAFCGTVIFMAVCAAVDRWWNK